jgi:AraC-like DNA-binding protein
LGQRIDQGISWTHVAFHNLRFMRAFFVQHAFKPHAHDYFVLGIIEKGVQSFTHERQRHITTPDHLIVINPGEMHTGEAVIADGFQYRAFYPTQDLMRSVARDFAPDADHLPRFGGSVRHDPQLFRLFQRLHQRSETVAASMALEEDLNRFLVTLVRRHAIGQPQIARLGPQQAAIARTRDYLEAHYAEPLTLDQLAQQVSLSPFHLARLFQQHTGIPPHKYLESVRVRHAERLLASGTPIAETAFATGFSSQSHLNRTFKKLIGTTPGVFVQQRKIV